MPLLAVYLTLNSVPELTFLTTQNLKLIYFSVIISTIVLPIISIILLMKIGKMDSLEMSQHKERVLPLLHTTIFMLLGYFFLQNILFYTPFLMAQLLGAAIITSLASILSNFWKISLHMLGIGGVLGVLVAIHIIYKSNFSLIIIFILLSGILGSSRLNEKAHNKPQVYIGFLIGLLIELIVVLNY